MSDEVKELAIGEVGEIDGVRVKCVEGDQSPDVFVCYSCLFAKDDCEVGRCSKVACHPSERIDGLYVIFKEV